MPNHNNPKNAFRFNKFFNISLVFLCFLLIIIGKFDIIALRNLSSFLTDYFAPVSTVVNIPAKEIENVIDDVKSVTQLRQENLRFKTEIRRLKIIEKNSQIQESELIELKRLLNFIPRDNQKLITGRVLNISGGTFAKTMLINAGIKDGVEIGQPVISSDGLVGSIVNVGPSSSRVLLIIDINSMTPIFLSQSGWPAIVQGQNGSLLKLRFLSSDATPIIGEVVETSGHGGKYPTGLNVGKIVSSNGNFLVLPSSNPQKLRFVSIISGSKKYKIDRNNIGLAPLQDKEQWMNLKGFNKIND